MVNAECETYDELIFISCAMLDSNRWTTIVRKGDEYIVYKSVLDWIRETYRINQMYENALAKAFEKLKDCI